MTMGNQPIIVADFKEETGELVIKLPGQFLELSCDIMANLVSLGRVPKLHETFLKMVALLEMREREERFLMARKQGIL